MQQVQLLHSTAPAAPTAAAQQATAVPANLGGFPMPPFPTPPAIRKVPDEIFEHIAAAIDPPEVVIDLNPTSKLPFVICGETLRRYFRRQGLLLSSCLSFCAVRRFTVIKPVRIANE